MLSYTTVYPATLELLKSLMQMPELQEFFLVGGTALALQIGHRISVDLDLFTPYDFDSHLLMSVLKKHYASIELLGLQNNTLNLVIDNIKVDLITYAYPLIYPIKIIDDVRLLGLEDIAPMKLSATANRGTKKDFFDLYFLLQQYSLKELFQFFDQKFNNPQKFHVFRSLTYFEDAEHEVNPIMLKNITWEDVKAYIIKVVRNF